MKSRSKKKNVTVLDVAREAGLSPMTVSRVFDSDATRSKVRPGTREKVEAVARQLGYRPSTAARNLRLQRSHQIGVYLNWKHHGILSHFGWPRVFGALQRQAAQYGYRVAFHFQDDTSETNLKDFFQPGRYVDGLVVLGRNIADKEIRLLRESGLPTVSLYEEIDGFVCLLANDRRVGRQAADYLYARGHRDVAVLAYRNDREHWNLRYYSFMERAQELGLQIVQQYYQPAGMDKTLGWEHTFGYQNAPLPLGDKGHFTALWIPSDFLTVGAIHRYEDEGWEVGKDLSVLSYDNAEAHGIRYWDTPRITSFELNREQIGVRAADILCSGNPEKPVHSFDSTLIERTSVCDGPAAPDNILLGQIAPIKDSHILSAT